MAIKMVREPSETPNINNIDDIIPMRYAYGGQNGYVIGKGTEISNTVNGSNFIVNSGRLVLQGVECDIDASGVTIAVDNIATKRYYVVYLQVNLATNQVTIDSTYDTADYPVINSGDDLTENSSGIARLALYKFTAINGVISDVNKIVDKLEYTNTALNGYDSSKGSIEERLTNLGFNQGSFSIQKTGTAPEIRQNYIKKQGKYCIGSLDIGVSNTFGGNHYLKDYTILIPNEFRPLNDTDITCGQYANGFSIPDLNIATLKTTGEITFASVNESSTTDTATAINFGWECV